jgi:hypothetical protein
VSYLAEIKSDLKGLFDEAFDHAWKEIVEPALKQSYRNGVADARAGKGNPDDAGDAKPRRQWGQRRKAGGESDG